MVEIIPKPVQKLPLWQNILFYSSLALLVAGISSLFLLERSLKNSRLSLKYLEETLTGEKTIQEVSLEKNILSWQKRIKNFSQLFSRHLYSLPAFDLIEKLTHPEVWFSQLNLDLPDSKAVASGQAESFTVLGQQLGLLEKEPEISDFALSSLSIGKQGKVNFTLNISFAPALFQSKK